MQKKIQKQISEIIFVINKKYDFPNNRLRKQRDYTTEIAI